MLFFYVKNHENIQFYHKIHEKMLKKAVFLKKYNIIYRKKTYKLKKEIYYREEYFKIQGKNGLK